MSSGIDFNGSTLTWLTRSQKSYGRFSIEATLTTEDLETRTVITYYLISGVMAGNVHGPPPLIKDPTYAFQAMFSDNGSFKILRTYANHADDTLGITEEVFENIDVRLKSCAISRLDSIGRVLKATLENRTLTSKVVYRIAAHEILMEFPIKHINVKDEGGQAFQVETGPLLFMVPNSNCDLDSLTLSYVNFNRFDQLTYAVPKSRMNLQENIGFYSQVNVLDAEVRIFEIL